MTMAIARWLHLHFPPIEGSSPRIEGSSACIDGGLKASECYSEALWHLNRPANRWKMLVRVFTSTYAYLLARSPSPCG